MTTRRWLILALVAAAVLLIVGRTLAGVYSDYLWYESVGASALWRTRMSSVVLLRLGSGIVASLFAFANLYAVRQSVVSLVFPRRLAHLEIGEEVPGKVLMGAAAGLALILGGLLAMPSDHWMSVSLARSSQPFGELDPFFGQDMGFFVYWLPLENTLWMWAFFVVVMVSVVVILLYALTPSLKWQRSSLYASAYVRRHVTVLVGIMLLLLAWSFRLDMYGMLVDGSATDGAFGWADHRVGVPGDLLLSLLTLGAALIVLWAGFVGQLRLAAISVITSVALSLIIREIAPAVATHTGTDAERMRREQGYMATRATYTRRAYATDLMPHADTSAAFPSLAAAMPWVTVWDPPALDRVASAGRVIDDTLPLVAWRATPAGLTANVIESPPTGASAKTPWTAMRILASDADERGSPLRLGDSQYAADDSPIDAPLIYPNAPKMIVIADSLKLTAGTPLESFFGRLATAWSTQNFGLLSNDESMPRPTLISHRDVRDRLTMYAPFFAQGRRVEPILLGDTLFWSVDLYSASDYYPLSRHFLIVGEERAYFQHAAVAIVQASTGEITVVADSILDPVAKSWKQMLPSIFGTWGSLPAGLRAQLPPAIDGLSAKANAYGRFGARGENDPARHVPTLDGADSALTSDHLPLALPGARSTAIALPLVDETDRLRGLLIGTGGTSRTTYWYPLANAGPRWSNILDRLRSVDSAGSAAREGPLAHGRVRAVPVRSGIAFVQPSYRWRGQGVPTVARVAQLTGDSVRSIAPPFGVSTAATLAAAAGPSDFRTSVATLYAAMKDALRRGDLVAFGKAFDALGRALAQPR
jgi:uncharacterized membrane protein (UPF0182 family)